MPRAPVSPSARRIASLPRVSPVDAATAWTAPGCDGLSWLRARYERQHFPRHTHDTYVIGVNERGAHATWHRGSTQVIPTGALAIIAPGDVHTGQPVPNVPWHYRALYVTARLLEELAQDTGDRRKGCPQFALLVNDPHLAAQFLRLHRRSECSVDVCDVQEAAADLLSSLVRRHAVAGPGVVSHRFDPLAVRRVTEYLHDHLPDPVTLHDLASTAGVGRYELIRSFRRAHGLTPYAYLIQLRVERAKLLLARGDRPMDVAQATGFADQSHLTRMFRRLTGVTPARYVRGIRS